MSTAAEKTSSLFSGFTSKLSQMKNSESFKSFEGKVGGAYESVKVRVSRVRSLCWHRNNRPKKDESEWRLKSGRIELVSSLVGEKIPLLFRSSKATALGK